MAVGTVTKLTHIKKLKEGLDYCDIVIDELPYKLFGSYNDSLQFLNKRVVFDTRPDVYEGKFIEVIANVVEKTVVQTVTETKGVKLIPAVQNIRPMCNYALDTLQPGDRLRDIVVYLSGYKVDSSPKAKWFDMQVVDIKSKVYTVRYFTTRSAYGQNDEAKLQSMVGRYIQLNYLAITKYGYQVETRDEDLEPAVKLLEAEVLLPPEVEVAIGIIEDAVKDDIELSGYMQKYEYIEKLKRVIEVEPGFHLVRVATEIILIRAMSNVTNMYSEKLLIRAAVCSRGHLIDRKNDLSKVVLNVNRISRSSLASDVELINIIDVAATNTSPIKRAYVEIAKFANFIVDERRGLIDEKEIIARNESISNMFGRLL